MALSKEMAAKQALQEQLRELQDQSRREKDDLYRQIDELRETLSAEERSMARKEEQIRRERDDLMARLEQSENRHEELSGENCAKKIKSKNKNIFFFAKNVSVKKKYV